jgi:STE24 endopeptidase
VNERPAERPVALAVALGGGVVLLLLAWALVPPDAVAGLHLPAASDVFDPAFLDRAESYARTARAWSWSALAVSLVVSCLLGFTRAGRALVGRLPGPWWCVVVLAVALLAVIGRVVTLPLGLALHAEQVRVGLSTQGTGAWLLDVARSVGVGVVFTSLALLVLVGTARRLPRAWPVVAGAVLGLLVLGASFVYPLLVEPLFNDFESLPPGQLRTDVLALADEEGVAVDDVLVADASRRTTTLNAYVSGYGSTRRVVLYDNLVEDLPRDQALSVVAHELAHAKHRDVVTGSVLGAVGVFAGVGLLGLVVGGLRRRTGVGMADPRVVPLVLALVAVGSLLASPLQNAVSRRIEARADADALAATHDPAAFEAMQQRLAEKALADPTPPAWSQWWFGSHPTSLQRIALARSVDDG